MIKTDMTQRQSQEHKITPRTKATPQFKVVHILMPGQCVRQHSQMRDFVDSKLPSQVSLVLLRY